MFEIPHGPTTVDVKIADDESLKIVYGSRVGFHTIDLVGPLPNHA